MSKVVYTLGPSSCKSLTLHRQARAGYCNAPLPFLHSVDLDKILNGLKTLTPREHEVLNQVISGRCSREIASELGITIRTVKEYRVRIMKKMEANSLAELVIKIVITRLHESGTLIGDTDRGEVISDPATSSGQFIRCTIDENRTGIGTMPTPT